MSAQRPRAHTCIVTRHVRARTAGMEGAHAAFAFTSGMAALSNMTRLLKAGDEILCNADVRRPNLPKTNKVARRTARTHVHTPHVNRAPAVSATDCFFYCAGHVCVLHIACICGYGLAHAHAYAGTYLSTYMHMRIRT